MTGSLRKAVDELAELTIGMDPLRIEAVTAKLRAGTGDSCGPGGIFTLAASAIDIALWDIKGKALDQPLWKLLGGHRDRVPTYASGSLRRGLTDSQAQRAAQILVQKGFTEMKTQMALPGNPSPTDEIRRIRVVREAIVGSGHQTACATSTSAGASGTGRSTSWLASGGCRPVLAGGRHHRR